MARPDSVPAQHLSAVGCRWALRIGHTWDGAAVGEDEVVAITMALGATELTLRIMAPFHDDSPPDSNDLWTHEVVELMLLGAGDVYLEVELSPHGRSLVLFLHGARNVVRRSADLDYRAEIGGKRWTGVAKIPVDWLPVGTDRLNAYAIHGTGVTRRYLAWRPTGGRNPDFHRLAAFGALAECREGPGE